MNKWELGLGIMTEAINFSGYCKSDRASLMRPFLSSYLAPEEQLCPYTAQCPFKAPPIPRPQPPCEALSPFIREERGPEA